MRDLTDRLVWITGAGTGIGAAAARRLARAGCRLVLSGRRPEPLQAVAAEIGDGAHVLALDVSDRDSVREAVAAVVSEHGGIDVLANVAGLVRFGRFEDTTQADWQLQLDVNLTGPFNTIQEALPSLVERRGSIVNVGSIAGLKGQAYQVGYGASKAALINLTKGIAVEFASRGVRANCVCPGTVLTPLIMAVGDSLPPDEIGRAHV